MDALVEAERHAYAQRVRATLDGQRAADRRDEIALRYGPIYSLDAIRQRVRKTLPLRPFRFRVCRLTSINTYTGRIPEVALCRLGEAKASDLFDRFLVAEPTYEDANRPFADPWLLGVWEEYPTEAVIIAAWA
jgi:hypothetical protein